MFLCCKHLTRYGHLNTLQLPARLAALIGRCFKGAVKHFSFDLLQSFGGAWPQVWQGPAVLLQVSGLSSVCLSKSKGTLYRLRFH